MGLIPGLKVHLCGFLATFALFQLSLSSTAVGEGSSKVDGLTLDMSKQEVEHLMAKKRFFPLATPNGAFAYCLDGRSYESVLGPVVSYDGQDKVLSVVGDQLQSDGQVLTVRDELGTLLIALNSEPKLEFGSGHYKYLSFPMRGIAVKFYALEGENFIHSFRLYRPQNQPEIEF